MVKNFLERLTFHSSDENRGNRLRELILYISEKCLEDPTFGATKLNKLLFFADFISYQLRGIPVTGVKYMRLRQGPVPKYMIPIRQEMEKNQEIVLKKHKFYNYEQHRVIALRDPDLSLFSPYDIAFVDEIIREFWGKTGTETSELSHSILWKIAREKEDIPYQAVFLAEPTIDDDDLRKAQELIHEHGWDV